MATLIKKIMVLDGVGDALAMDEGEAVYDLIHPELLAGHCVELDFEGVDLIAPIFLNTAIGDLLEDIKLEDFKRLFRATNLDELDTEILGMVITDSYRYYTDPVYHAALDAANDKVARGEYDR